MKRLHQLRKNKLIKLFALLFMTLNLAIVTVGGFSYSYILNIFDRVITEFNLSTIENVSSILSNRFSSGEKLAQEIYHTAEMGELPDKSDLTDPADRLAAKKLINFIQYGVDSNSTLADAYVYLSRSDMVISNSGMYDARFFYENYATHKGMDYETWKNWLCSQRQPLYQRATLAYSTHETELIEYCRPFNAYSNLYYGCVVLNYDPELLQETLSNSTLLRNANTQVHYLPTGAQVLSSGNADINDYVYKLGLKPGDTILNKTPYGELITVRHSSLDHNWEYITTLSTDIFYSQAQVFIWIVVLFISLQIVIGALLTMLFSAKSYQPIHTMVGKLRTMADDYAGTDSVEELEEIEKITHRVIVDHKRLKGELEDIRPMMLRSGLLQILNGNRSDRDYALNYMSQFSEYFPLDGFVCAKVLIEDNSGFVRDDSLAEMQLTRLVISNVTEELFQNQVRTVSLDFDMRDIVLVFNIAWSDNPDDMAPSMHLIEEQLKKSQILIAEQCKIYTSIGVSRPHQGLRNLYKCHLQAQSALANQPVSDVYGLNFYDEKQAGALAYSYSLDTEIYLMNSAKAGDYAKVTEILDTLAEENAGIFTDKAAAVSQCFMVDLVGTLLRLCEELSVPADVLDINVAELLSSKCGASVMRQLYKDYEILCNWINGNKKSHNDKMKDQIVEYIQEHCCDNSMSLVSVADHIGINPTYLSAFIKEQVGETFLNYVLNLRMERAKEYLQTTNLSLQEIAVRIGYANSGVFLRVFKKKYGLTPGAYRRQSGN